MQPKFVASSDNDPKKTVLFTVQAIRDLFAAVREPLLTRMQDKYGVGSFSFPACMLVSSFLDDHFQKQGLKTVFVQIKDRGIDYHCFNYVVMHDQGFLVDATYKQFVFDQAQQESLPELFVMPVADSVTRNAWYALYGITPGIQIIWEKGIDMLGLGC